MFPIDSTEEIFNSINELHLAKALLPIDVTEEGIDTCVNEVHPTNELDSMDVIVGGIETCLSFVKFLKRFSSIRSLLMGDIRKIYERV